MSDGLDTALARRLHARRLVPKEKLLALLGEARSDRTDDLDLQLSWLLVDRGHVAPDQIDELLAELGELDLSAARPDERDPTGGEAERRIGPYRVLRLLGRGGMGAVFEAEDERTRERVALKLLVPLADPDDRERFRREAQALQLEHPNLVRTLGFEVEGAHPYIALELVSGGSLQDRVAQGPLPLEELRPLAEQLAAGLEALHNAGVLHRDLKPANVLLSDEGRVLLADFGLARLPGAQTLTRTGDLLGTPGFMAPEQARDSSRVSSACDVYGMATTLFAAATGQPPFAEAGVIQTLMAVMEEPPPSPRKLRPELSDAFQAGILAGLSKEIGDRPSSATALVQMCFPGPAPAAQQPGRARAGLWALAVAIPLVLLGLWASQGLPLEPSHLPSRSPTATPLAPAASPSESPREELATLLGLDSWSAAQRERVWTLAAAEDPDDLARFLKGIPRKPHQSTLRVYARLRVHASVGRRDATRSDLVFAVRFDSRVRDYAQQWSRFLDRGRNWASGAKIPGAEDQEAVLSGTQTLSRDLPRPLREHLLASAQTVLARTAIYLSVTSRGKYSREDKDRFVNEVVSIDGSQASRLRARLIQWHFTNGWDKPADVQRAALYQAVRVHLLSSPEVDAFDRVLVAELAQLDEPDFQRAEQLAQRVLRAHTQPLARSVIRRLHLRRVRRLAAVAYGKGSRPPEREAVARARAALVAADRYPDFHERRVGRWGVVLALLELRPGDSAQPSREKLEEYKGRVRASRDEDAETISRIKLLSIQIKMATGEIERATAQLERLLLDSEAGRLPAEAFAISAHLRALRGESPHDQLAAYAIALRTRNNLGFPWYRADVVEAVVAGEAWWPQVTERK
ncbi:MAG: serine/threonine protein kinase [Planctomycetes bacterium]|nr:serine/threonine protein kinase [Planctomycetota bacterium]